MSKLLDSLTGYFFSPDAEREADRPLRDDEGMSSTRGSGPDPVLVRGSPSPVASHVAARIRKKLRGRSVRRDTAPPQWDGRAWGDDDDTAPRIHPLAHVDPRAELAPDVEVGAFCVVGPHVSLGPGCRLLPHAMVLGHTTCGSDNTFHPFCVVGGDPQDKKFAGEDTYLVLGDGNDIREHVTIHCGTATGGGTTRVGDSNLLMVGAHIGHDAIVGSGCVIGNNVMLAGHVVIGDRVSMMGGSAVHHFVTIGDYVFIAGYAQIHADIPPYVKVAGNDDIRAINVVGIRRGGKVSEDDLAALEVAAKALFLRRKTPMSVKIDAMKADSNLNPRVRQVIDSIERRSRGKHGRYLEGLRHA